MKFKNSLVTLYISANHQSAMVQRSNPVLENAYLINKEKYYIKLFAFLTFECIPRESNTVKTNFAGSLLKMNIERPTWSREMSDTEGKK